MPYTEVVPGLWRGPEPTQADVPWITRTIATVIRLEQHSQEALELHPIPVKAMLITPWQIYNPFTFGPQVTQEYLADILMSINRGPHPVLVHCEHGEDRTGLVIAAYRVLFPKWTKEEAMHEALIFGYRRWLNFGLNRTWKNFDAYHPAR